VAKREHIKTRDPLLQKVVFEVRYRHGFVYLDNCGRTINKIMSESPEWILQSGAVSPQNAPLASLSNSALFNFSSLKYDLSIERPPDKDPLSSEDVDALADQAEFLHAIVSDSLGLEEFTRIGFRAWYVFACSSREDAEQWLRDLGCYRVEPKLVSAFGSDIDSSSMSVVILGHDRKFRIALNGVEIQAQIDFGQGILSVSARSLSEDQKSFLIEQQRVKRRLRQSPEFAAMIDIDAFHEDPVTIEPKDFITSSFGQFLPSLLKAVS